MTQRIRAIEKISACKERNDIGPTKKGKIITYLVEKIDQMDLKN